MIPYVGELMYPWMLALLALVPLLWWLWSRAERRPALRFSRTDGLLRASAFAPAVPPGERAAEMAGRWNGRMVLPVLRTVALFCLIVAAARPREPNSATFRFAEGIAIQMVIDVSSSMSDRDLAPRGYALTRLDVVKQVFRRFVKGDERELSGRPNDLIGMIRFARFADSVCPLTLDHDTLLEALQQTQLVTTQDEDGTAIGDGLALAVERLRDLQRTVGSGEQLTIKSKIIILLTDGENNAGAITPQQAGELAAKFGIRVYTIIAGTGQNMGFMRRPLDDRLLREIAALTGGRHYQATDARSLQQIYDAISDLETTRVEQRAYTTYSERSQPWLLAAFAALALQLLLDATLLRKLP